MTQRDSDPTVDDITDIARRAGDAILKVYRRTDFDVRIKADDSPLTEADLAANDVIMEGLRAISDLPILSEESKLMSWEERRSWSSFWMVDPLDGTKEFIKRNDEFTVNIALIRDGEPVVGVVHVPALGKTYRGAQSVGAQRLDDEGTHQLAVRTDVGDPVSIVVSRSHLRDADREFIDRVEDQHGAVQTVPTGSSLKLCLVAEGLADVYPRFGPTMEWDIAAAQAVLVHAGGVVEKVDGGTLEYNKEELINPFFIARSTAFEI